MADEDKLPVPAEKQQAPTEKIEPITQPSSPVSKVAAREDWRDEWYGFDRGYLNQPPKIYWLGIIASVLWIVIYLLLYPSIPLLRLEWR